MSASVNKPMNVKQKEADVNRKLQLYGIYSAFAEGKVPSNEQIDIALNSFLASKALSNPPSQLSEEGRALVADVKSVVEQAKLLVLSKNEGNLLQDFIWQCMQFDPKVVNTPNAPLDKETAKQHGDKALAGLRTLGTLLITNGQFRKLLNDGVVLLRDIAGDAAVQAATKINPSEEALAKIDEPAADNTWHDAPDFSTTNIKNQFQSVYKGDAKKDAQEVADAATGAAAPAGANTNPAAVDAQSGALAAHKKALEKADEKIDDDTKEAVKTTAAEYRRRTKEYLAKKMPEGRREQTIWRLKKMVLECQQHPDYEQAITTLLDLAEEYGTHAKALTAGGAGTVKEGRSALQAAEADLKTLIERFANGTSSDDLWESIGVIYSDAQKDPELNNWFKDIDTYIRKILKQQGYIMEDASNEDWNRLYDRGNYLLREKYRGHTDRVVDELKFLADQFDKDPMNKRFGATVQKLFTDLGNDENGKPTFKPHLIKDLTEVILPALFESVAYIPIPRIEFSDPQVDLVIENLVLESDNFMPNVLEIASDHYFRFGRKKVSNANRNSIDIKVSGIQLDLHDVSYYVKRKDGFPKITDTGVLNILLPGDGFGFRMKLSTAEEKDRQHFFKIDKLDVDVSKLQIKVVKSKHKVLLNLFKGTALKVLRPAIQKAAEKEIKDQFNQFDELVYQVRMEANRALEEAKENPENVQNIYQRYVSAFQKKALQGQKKVEQVAGSIAEKKVNVAVTKHDSIFPNIHLPGGISSKATEYKDIARQGERWESPIFTIGDGAKTDNVPKAPEITRKVHETTTPNPVAAPATNGSSGVYPHATNGSSGIYPANGQSVYPLATNGVTNGVGKRAPTVAI